MSLGMIGPAILTIAAATNAALAIGQGADAANIAGLWICAAIAGAVAAKVTP